MFDAFQLPFMQQAALEVVLLAPLAGLLGAQIVLRGLAFYTHGVGTAAFPGLVLAGPIGVPATLTALVTSLTFAGALNRLNTRRGIAYDAATALLLVAALAAGIVLASDVFESGSSVDQLLFGSLLAIGPDELRLTVVVLVLAGGLGLLLRRRWTAAGFDPAAVSSLGLRTRASDAALMVAIAVTAIVTLDATGALLVGSLLVVPAATARLHARSMRSLELGAAAIALVIGLAGLLIAYELDAPPGSVVALLGGASFLVAALATVPRSRRSRGAA